MCRPFLAAVMFALATLATTPRVFAHALGAECKLRADRVEVEAYFSDDTPASGARVVVADSGKRAVIEGKTDDYGRWSFPIPAPGRYEVTVDAGDGHKAVVGLSVPESATASPAISDGPSRAEFTQTPWLKVGLGLLLIGAVAIGLRLIAHRVRKARRKD